MVVYRLCMAGVCVWFVRMLCVCALRVFFRCALCALCVRACVCICYCTLKEGVNIHTYTGCESQSAMFHENCEANTVRSIIRWDNFFLFRSQPAIDFILISKPECGE